MADENRRLRKSEILADVYPCTLTWSALGAAQGGIPCVLVNVRNTLGDEICLAHPPCASFMSDSPEPAPGCRTDTRKDHLMDERPGTPDPCPNHSCLCWIL